MPGDRLLPWIVKPAVFILCLLPLALLSWNLYHGNLSANPVDDVTDVTGRWTLRFLLITLAVTPLRRLTGLNSLIRFRRMLGLFAFFYGLLHLGIYVVLYHFFDWREILRDVPQRPFIAAGFVAFVCLTLLAVTSTRKWIGRLGGRRWQRLHRLIYLSAVAGVLHYIWIVKVVEAPQIAYTAALGALLGFRVVAHLRARSASRTRDRQVAT